jgi:D-alanyl-D-alanine carboxypeptidase
MVLSEEFTLLSRTSYPRKMKKTVIALAFAIGLTAGLNAQEFPQALADDLQSVLISQTSSVFKGASACVILPDGSEWIGVSGIANPGDNVDTTRLWSMGSQVKSLIATMIMMLDDDGMLSIEDSIKDYIDPIENVDPNITIKSLMNHTSGLGEYWSSALPLWGDVFGDRSRVWTIDEVLPYIPEPVATAPASYNYINTGAIILGLVIESVTGKHPADAVDDMIFTPLGMKHSHFPVSEYDASELNGVWNFNNGSPVNNSGLQHTAYVTSRYAYIGRIEEATRFMRKRLSGELYSALLHEATFEEAPGSVADVPFPAGTYRTSYGLGFNMFEKDGLFAAGHGGTGLSQSMTFHFPDSGFTVGVVNNAFNSTVENVTLFQNTVDAVMAYLADPNPDIVGSPSADLMGRTFNIYPNPVAEEMFMDFTLEETAPVSVILYDLRGSKVATLIDRRDYPVGNVSLKVQLPASVPGGVYFLQLQSGTERFMRKVIVRR